MSPLLLLKQCPNVWGQFSYRGPRESLSHHFDPSNIREKDHSTTPRRTGVVQFLDQIF